MTLGAHAIALDGCFDHQCFFLIIILHSLSALYILLSAHSTQMRTGTAMLDINRHSFQGGTAE